MYSDNVGIVAAASIAMRTAATATSISVNPFLARRVMSIESGSWCGMAAQQRHAPPHQSTIGESGALPGNWPPGSSYGVVTTGGAGFCSVHRTRVPSRLVSERNRGVGTGIVTVAVALSELTAPVS